MIKDNTFNIIMFEKINESCYQFVIADSLALHIVYYFDETEEVTHKCSVELTSGAAYAGVSVSYLKEIEDYLTDNIDDFKG